MKNLILTGITCLAIGLTIGLSINWTPKFINERDTALQKEYKAGVADGQALQKRQDGPLTLGNLKSILKGRFTWYGDDDYANY